MTEPDEMPATEPIMPSEDNPPALPAGRRHPGVLRELWCWARTPAVRWWLWPVGLGLIGVIGLHPLDAPLGKLIEDPRWLRGDLRRELQTLQQFGAIGSVALACVIVWLVDPARRARLADLIVAVAGSAVVALGAKMLIGRPRPKYDDPDTFLGPLGVYPVGREGEAPVLTHAWEFTRHGIAELWSMPSSHTAAAAALGVALCAIYPRLRPLTLFMVVLVGFCRLVFDAHYLTDVVCGGALGAMIASGIMRHSMLGRRLGARAGRRGRTLHS